MKAWPIPLWGLACLIAAGCRTNPEVTRLQRENRLLEDRVYDLQYERDRAAEDLDKCRRDNRSQRDKTAPVSTQIETSKGAGRSSRGSAPPLNPPGLNPPPAEADDGLPKIIVETPKEPLPQGETPGILKRPLATPPAQPSLPPQDPQKNTSQDRPLGSVMPVADIRPSPAARHDPGTATNLRSVPGLVTDGARPATPPAQPVIPVGGIALVPGTDSARAARITLNQQAVGGWEADGRPGDDGIIAIIEPRDAQGRMIATAGAISVVLVDRALPGEAARVARWDLTAHQAASRFRRMPAGDGIYLELPWPKTPPIHSPLQLFVRFTTRDGRNLETNQRLDIALANQFIAMAPLAAEGPVGPAGPTRRAPAADASPGQTGLTRLTSQMPVLRSPPSVPPLTPPELRGTWKATTLPKEVFDDRRTDAPPDARIAKQAPHSPSEGTSQPSLSPGERVRVRAASPATEAPATALIDPDTLPGPASPAGEAPPRERPVWSPERR